MNNCSTWFLSVSWYITGSKERKKTEKWYLINVAGNSPAFWVTTWELLSKSRIMALINLWGKTGHCSFIILLSTSFRRNNTINYIWLQVDKKGKLSKQNMNEYVFSIPKTLLLNIMASVKSIEEKPDLGNLGEWQITACVVCRFRGTTYKRVRLITD